MSGLEHKVAVSWLLSFYGNLLTDRQKDMLFAYYEEDQSLGEIAGQLSVTRQCVHDTLRRSEEQLSQYEEKLGLCEKYRREQETLTRCLANIDAAINTLGANEALLAARAEIKELISMEDD